MAREVGHKTSEAIDIKNMGDILTDQGDLQGAMQMYQQAVAIQHEIDDKSYYASTLVSIGKLRRRRETVTERGKFMKRR